MSSLDWSQSLSTEIQYTVGDPLISFELSKPTQSVEDCNYPYIYSVEVRNKTNEAIVDASSWLNSADLYTDSSATEASSQASTIQIDLYTDSNEYAGNYELVFVADVS